MEKLCDNWQEISFKNLAMDTNGLSAGELKKVYMHAQELASSRQIYFLYIFLQATELYKYF